MILLLKCVALQQNTLNCLEACSLYRCYIGVVEAWETRNMADNDLLSRDYLYVNAIF